MKGAHTKWRGMSWACPPLSSGRAVEFIPMHIIGRVRFASVLRTKPFTSLTQNRKQENQGKYLYTSFLLANTVS